MRCMIFPFYRHCYWIERLLYFELGVLTCLYYVSYIEFGYLVELNKNIFELFLIDLTVKIQNLKSEMEAKLNRKVQEMLRKLEEANPMMKLDIKNFSATISSVHEDNCTHIIPWMLRRCRCHINILALMIFLEHVFICGILLKHEFGYLWLVTW